MIERSVREEAVWIRLDRPEKLNALHLDDWRDLHEELERASTEARVAVITGTGDAFCAGDDIGTLESMDTADDVNEPAERLHDVLFGIEELSIPVITAINGLAYGGGCEIVAASDIAVAVEEATFALPETRIGAYPPFAAERIAEFAGKKRSMELMLTGEPIDAEAALRMGLVSRVTDDPRAVADELAAVDHAALKRLKRLVRDDGDRQTQEEREQAAFADLVPGADL
jgi:enoyl-CoA hydratase/carnithine racemase